MHLRNSLLPLLSILLAGALAAGSGSVAYGQPRTGDSEPKTITIGFVNWTEAIAVTHLMQALVEQKLNYDVKLRLVGVEEAFQGVASGELDAFLDVWLPTTHGNYWQQYQSQVDDLGIWYQGQATLGIAVPDYVEAESIGDLAGQIDQYHGRIVGIQPGAGLMRITREQVIPAYGLHDFTLTSGDTSRMIAAVDRAIRRRQPIAFTAWKPHWLFSAYPIRYLQDPKGTLTQVDEIHAIARQGLRQAAPRVYALLKAFSLTEEELGSLELAVADARSAYGGVRRWLAENEDVVAPWIIAASRGRKAGFY